MTDKWMNREGRMNRRYLRLLEKHLRQYSLPMSFDEFAEIEMAFFEQFGNRRSWKKRLGSAFTRESDFGRRQSQGSTLASPV